MKPKYITYQNFIPDEIEYDYYRPQYNWDKPKNPLRDQQKPEIKPEIEDIEENITNESNVDLPIILSPKKAEHVFKYDNINVGNMQTLLDKFSEAGISLRITSGMRPGAKTSSGKTSWHAKGEAIDVTPIEGQTYEDLLNKIKNSPDLIKYMRDNNYGIYDETYQSILNQTGGTGSHWHIGKDQVAIKNFKDMLSGKYAITPEPLTPKAGFKKERYVDGGKIKK